MKEKGRWRGKKGEKMNEGWRKEEGRKQEERQRMYCKVGKQ